jgi:hypothetical protein
MTRSLLHEYILRYPSKNKGRGEGMGGLKYSEWTESLALCILRATNWAGRELNSITKNPPTTFRK